jgi:hypothetical protein
MESDTNEERMIFEKKLGQKEGYFKDERGGSESLM